MINIEAKGNVILICDACNMQHTIEGDSMSWDEVECEERAMGSEITYETSHIFGCDCKKEIEFKVLVYEYPKGAINYVNYEIEGAQIRNKFDISIIS